MAENTYRTILFEEFDKNNKDKLNIHLMKKPSTTEMFDIVDTLSVKSFDEFVDKFVPNVYQNFRSSKDGFVIEYSFEDNGTAPVRVTDTPYFKMLLQMYDSKGKSGKSNLKFDFHDVLKTILPEAIANKAKDTRLLLESYAEDYYKAEDEGRSTKRIEEKINDELDNVQNMYKNSIQGLLPLAISEANTKIKFLEAEAAKFSACQDGETPPLLGVGMLAWGMDGGLEIKEVKALPEKIQGKEDSDNRALTLVTENVTADYDDFVEETGNDSNAMRSLVLSTFAPNLPSFNFNSLDEITEELEKIKREKAQYQSAYKTYLETFARDLQPLLEKILSVKVYFDHATVSGELNEGAELIVANCKPLSLVSVDIVGEFSRFIEHFGNMTYDPANGTSPIWLAILPGYRDEDDIVPSSKTTRSSGFSRRAGRKSSSNGDDKMISIAKLILSVMEKGHVLTFFSDRPNENNVFSGITSKFIEDRRIKLEESGIRYKYASYAYPNFRLMDELTERMEGERLTVPAVHIESCYVACGLTAGMQQPKYLKKKGIDDSLIYVKRPCVHVNVEDSGINIKLMTNLNRELPNGMEKDIIDTINDGSFGYCFGTQAYTGYDKAYVHCARTMSRGSDVPNFMPIHTALVEKYVQSVLNSIKFKDTDEFDKIFINGIVAEWIRDKTNHPDAINLVLMGNETIERDGSNVKIRFGKNESVVYFNVSSDDQ